MVERMAWSVLVLRPEHVEEAQMADIWAWYVLVLRPEHVESDWMSVPSHGRHMGLVCARPAPRTC